MRGMSKSTSKRPGSGTKFSTEQGFSAIKDGIKSNPNREIPSQRKPPWLRMRLQRSDKFNAVMDTVHTHRLATVCEESHCPNMGECWSNGTATIMLMGSVCTRACRFCAVDTGSPKGWLDPEEPANAARSVELMGRAIREANPTTAVEALTPDFSGSREAVETVVNSGLQVFAQNLETVERLTHRVRDPRAGYQQTLDVLAHGKAVNPDVLTKSSLMLGLGETEDEVLQSMRDLRDHGVDILTLGQYLRPTANHLPVEEWVTPEKFAWYREQGLELGFTEVASGPLVRSSYRADRILEQNNLGLPLENDGSRIAAVNLD